jgi:hypothetical protein
LDVAVRSLGALNVGVKIALLQAAHLAVHLAMLSTLARRLF